MLNALAIPNSVIYVLGSVLIFLAVVLVVAVLMQSGKDKGLSGSIAGGAETFFGKSKGGTLDKLLSRITIIVSVLFVALVIVLVILISKANVA